MGSSSSANRGPFWRADWFVALLVLAAVLLLSLATDAIDTVERRFYDFGSTSGNRQRSDRIAIIGIDDQSAVAASLSAARVGEANLQQTVIQASSRAASAVPGYDAAEKSNAGQRVAVANVIRPPSGPGGQALEEQQRGVETPPGKI